MTGTIETIRILVAAAAATFFLIAGIGPLRESLDQFLGDLQLAGHFNTLGSLAAFVVFLCDAIVHIRARR
jgi:hypothetical protein